MDVYLEVGKKKTFAGAVEWPGWCRSGRDEAGALESLLQSAPRFEKVLQQFGIPFDLPATIDDLKVVERLEGTQTTDFGAPDCAPSADSRMVDEPELQRLEALLKCCWQALDRAAKSADGKELRKGPRGGGREVDNIKRHVIGAEEGYLRKLAGKFKSYESQPLDKTLDEAHQAVLEALESAVRNGLPAKGPRGGTYWTPRYFVRRVAWHVLDHAWEIEDRST